MLYKQAIKEFVSVETLGKLALFLASHKLFVMNARARVSPQTASSIFAYLQTKVLISKPSCVLAEVI
jgi:hypothetical protein